MVISGHIVYACRNTGTYCTITYRIWSRVNAARDAAMGIKCPAGLYWRQPELVHIRIHEGISLRAQYTVYTPGLVRTTQIEFYLLSRNSKNTVPVCRHSSICLSKVNHVHIDSVDPKHTQTTFLMLHSRRYPLTFLRGVCRRHRSWLHTTRGESGWGPKLTRQGYVSRLRNLQTPWNRATSLLGYSISASFPGCVCFYQQVGWEDAGYD